jgi:hypothetical protein
LFLSLPFCHFLPLSVLPFSSVAVCHFRLSFLSLLSISVVSAVSAVSASSVRRTECGGGLRVRDG